MKLRILSGSDVRAAVGMTEAIAAMRDAFVQLSAGAARVPLRLPLESAGGVTLLMPAWLGRSGELGFKVVSVFGDNPRRGLPAVTALAVLLDAETGRPRALLDGATLTAVRTGAASGLATDLLAGPDAGVVALFGAGVQAATQLEAVRAVRPVREVRVVARRRESAERFAAAVEGIEAHAPADPERAVRGADIIITATDSAVPVFDGSHVAPGAHINAVGAYTTAMRELDGELVRRARVVVDLLEAALAEAGDLVIPLREGLFDRAHIATELGAVAAGRAPGRTAPDQVTLFKSVGVAVQDVALSARVVAAAEARGLGTVVDL